jgi:pyruvate ferredoxin oxidoreductase delta subunit
MDLTSKPASTNINKTGGWRTFVPRTDLEKCISCANCVRVCPETAVKMVKKAGREKPETDYDFCKGCGICAAECPVKAIEMKLDEK